MAGPVPRNDASFCTGRAEASRSEVLASVERRTRSNWAQQAHGTRPAEDTYAEEVLQRFRVAFTTCLESDAELLSAEDADVPKRWRRLLEFYDHSETRNEINNSFKDNYYSKIWNYVKLIKDVLTEMEELKKFQSSTFDTIARRRLVEDQNTILELTGKIQELQMRLIV